jgi:hypothetical protein
MPTPKTDWVEGEYFTPAAANTVATAVVDLQNQITALNNRNTITELESTATTSGGTTSLTIASKPIQEFTGTFTQIVKLPSASVPPGAQYTIINNGSASLTIQTSAAAAVMTLVAGSESTFISLVSNPTTAAQWQFINPVDVSLAQTLTSKTLTTPTLTTPVINGVSTGTGVATAGTASTLALRDAAGALTGNTLVSTVATGTAPLTVTSTTVVPNLNASTVAGYGPAQTAVANTVAARDSSANLNANAFTSTVATGTAPFTVASTTTVANLSAASIGGYSPNFAANANTMVLRDGNANALARGFIPGFTSTGTSATGVTLTCSTVASTTNQIQEFTGTSTQTVTLPTANVVAGQSWTIINNSSGAVTVQSSAGAAIGAALTTGTSAQFIALVATPTTAANWHRR